MTKIWAERRQFLRQGATMAVATCTPSMLLAQGTKQSPSQTISKAGHCEAPTRAIQSLAGKVAFITGGSSGIGLGIARSFLDAGMKVTITYRSKENFDNAMRMLKGAESRLHAIHVDVTDRSALESAAAESANVFGRVNVLVNNAGVQNTSPLGATSYESWDRLMAVNLGGVFNGIRAFLPLMKNNSDGGHIVSTASTLGLFTIGGSYAAYCASKFAVVAMMESLRAELAGTNIGVSVLCPGPVKSNLEGDLQQNADALEPLQVGQAVLRGILSNELYILTHPEFNSVVRQRAEAIAGSVTGTVPPTNSRTSVATSIYEHSVYAAEISRASC